MTEMISFGAGVNSVAMTIMLAEQGWRGPVVFADTGGEHPETYCYLEYFERQYLKPLGMEITRLEPGTKYHCNMSQVPLYDYCLSKQVIPLLAVRWCSSRWKGRPMDRWARDNGIDIHYIGISADEARRANGKPDYQRFPLIENWVNRRGCESIIHGVGLEMPQKSSCYFCPGQTIGEWHWLFRNHPDLFFQSMRLEHVASAAHDKRATLNNHLSLGEMLGRGWPKQSEMDLSDWLPCACRL